MRIADSSLGTPVVGIVGTESKDSQGEILDVAGADIEELKSGRGVWNSDHRNGFADVVGRIIDAKKIFGPEDCDNERERAFYEKVKAPIILASGYLFDRDGDHRAAKAVGAILRNQSRVGSALQMKASVEGGVIERGEKDKHILKRTKIQRVALTFSPANTSTLIETTALLKSATEKWETDLIKSLIPYAVDNVPCFREISDTATLLSICEKARKIKTLTKALSIGFEIPTVNSTGMNALMAPKISNSFNYISCGDCGKEQIFHKNQVKCRNCKKSFSFDGILDALKHKI